MNMIITVIVIVVASAAKARTCLRVDKAVWDRLPPVGQLRTKQAELSDSRNSSNSDTWRRFAIVPSWSVDFSQQAK